MPETRIHGILCRCETCLGQACRNIEDTLYEATRDTKYTDRDYAGYQVWCDRVDAENEADERAEAHR